MLGTAYQERTQGDASENQELSIAALEKAIQEWDSDDEAETDAWASTANNLANSYSKRVEGDHGENLEKAIAYAEAARVIRTRSKDPVLWARTTHVLANLYSERTRGGDEAFYIEQSLQYSREAEEVETRIEMPDEWGGVQRNFGNAYMKRIRGDQNDNLKMAVKSFRNSISVCTRNDSERWGDSYLGLANASQTLARIEQTESLSGSLFSEAIEAYKEAAAAFASLGWGDREARALFGMANCYTELPGPEAATLAYEGLERCLSVWGSGRYPLREYQVCTNQAMLCERLGRTADAYGWIRRAIDAFEDRYGETTSLESKTELLVDSAQLFRRAVDLAIQSGAGPVETFCLAERGRTHLLRDEAIRMGSDWKLPTGLLEQESEILEERRREWTELSVVDPASAVDRLDRVHEFTRQLLEVWNEIRSHPGGDKYVSERTGTISWPDIQEFVDNEIDGFALVEYEVLDDRVAVFVLRQGASEPQILTIPVKIDALARCAKALYRDGRLLGDLCAPGDLDQSGGAPRCLHRSGT